MTKPNVSSAIVPAKRAVGKFIESLNTSEAEVLSGNDNLPPVEIGIEGPRRFGLTIAFLVFGVFGMWAAFMPIEGASHATGAITPKSYKKVVQHLEGGIVKEILVKNGDKVSPGDTLLVIDNTQPKAQLEVTNTQMVSQAALEARLIAERDGRDAVTYPDFLMSGDANAQAEMAGQNQVFNARKIARDGEKAVLEERITQLQKQIVGMQAMHDSKTQLSASFADEMKDLRTLLAEGFADKVRLREVERQHESMEGESAELLANIAATEVQISETRLQIIQNANQFQTEVADELSKTQTQLKDLRERIVALTDVVSRTEIKTQYAGIVNNMQAHTIGGVIDPGRPIAEIVPENDELVVEAKVSPADIDRVAVGQTADIRFSTLSRRTVPIMDGTLINVSADSMIDQGSTQPYYLVRLELSSHSLAEMHKDGLVLVPGMPAEVFIHSGPRTFLQYVMKPFSNALSRSFRED
jgi:epimerase transport system membrane fusion protein